jgi:hypothetical protein
VATDWSYRLSANSILIVLGRKLSDIVVLADSRESTSFFSDRSVVTNKIVFMV